MELRRARPDEADTLAAVYLTSRESAGDAMPPGVHPPDDVRRHVRDDVLPRSEVWVAELDETVCGLLVLDGQDLTWLFVTPSAQRHGVGSALLSLAQSLRPEGLALWVFASNARAIAFYEARGFRAVRRTDGDNEEGAPDIRYVWAAHPEGYPG